MFDRQLKKISIKSDINITTLSSLFQTDPTITYNLNNKIFVASEHTLNRVDDLVMSNLSQSYEEGLGIDEAKKRLTVKYNGLKSWEASRIARTEINSAQNDACFDMYNELGCEYQQWWTAEDERVRDGKRGTADHRSLHGKIVRVGTRFSNGLLYPGDRQGSIKEWINCRCTTIPYLIPLGKMVPPGLTEFTEEDLINIPDWETPDLSKILNPTQVVKKPKVNEEEFRKDAKRLVELRLKFPHTFDAKEMSKISREMNAIRAKFAENNLDVEDFLDYEDIVKKIYKLNVKIKNTKSVFPTPYKSDKKYLENLLIKSGKTYEDYLTESLENEILKEMDLEWFENNYLNQFGRRFKDSYKLERLEELYPSETKEIIKKLLGPRNVDKLLSPGERGEYRRFLVMLEDAKKANPNKSDEEILRFFYKNFKRLDDKVTNPEYIVHIESNYDLPAVAGSNYEGFVKENYRVLKFKEYDFELWVGEKCDVDTTELMKALDNIPNSLLNQNNNKIIVSSSSRVLSKTHNQYVGGYCTHDNEIVIVMGREFDSKEFLRVVSHESGHAWDNNLGKITSRQSLQDDLSYYKVAKSEGGFVSSYGKKGYDKFGTYYSEDFAEAVREYVNYPTKLKQNFPKRYKFIDDLFKKEESHKSIRDMMNNERLANMNLSESKQKQFINEISEDILEDGKISKRTKSKLDEYWEKELRKEELKNQNNAERIFLLRNQLDMGDLSKAEMYSKNKELKSLVKEFEKQGIKWQDNLTLESINKVNKQLGIPETHNVKIWTEKQLRANLVRAFEYKIPNDLPVKEFNLKDPYEQTDWKEYLRLKYLKESKEYFIREGINYNELADDELVKILKNEGLNYGFFEDLDTLRYYRHIYDETKFLAPEKETEWIKIVKKWKQHGIDIESIADASPISLEEKEAWAFDLRIYQSKIPNYQKEIITQQEYEAKIRKYKHRLYKTDVSMEGIKTSPKNTSLKTVLADGKRLNDAQLEEFSDSMYGVDYDEVIDVLADYGAKFKDATKLKVHLVEDIDKWGVKATSHPSVFNSHERKGMRRYSGDDHERMNRYYKKGEVTRAIDEFHEFNEDINWTVEALDKGTNNKNMVLYKGSEEAWAVPVGEIGSMDKFQSTTVLPRVTNNFGNYKTVFIAPKNSVKGTYLDGMSKHSEELEVLLSPHQRYQTLYKDEYMTVVKLLG